MKLCNFGIIRFCERYMKLLKKWFGSGCSLVIDFCFICDNSSWKKKYFILYLKGRYRVKSLVWEY